MVLMLLLLPLIWTCADLRQCACVRMCVRERANKCVNLDYDATDSNDEVDGTV